LRGTVIVFPLPVRTESTIIAGSNVPDMPSFIHVIVAVALHGSAHGDGGSIIKFVAVIFVGGGATVYIWHAIVIILFLHYDTMIWHDGTHETSVLDTVAVCPATTVTDPVASPYPVNLKIYE